MTKIGDLVQVPPVKTVIELASVREHTVVPEKTQQMIQEIAATFVVTDDIKLNLETILHSVLQPEGRGFFLSGGFGSGKSHFLATLSLLLTYPDAWVSLLSQTPSLENFYTEIIKKRFCVVQIPLLEYAASESLEAITFQALERTLNSRWGFNLTLATDSYFLETFERYVLPTCNREIDAFIQKELGPGFTWQSLRNESQDLVRLTQQFLKAAPEAIPLNLNLNRTTAIDKTMAALASQKFSGLILLFDELSEFLKSKASPADLNEDARFLQFLGERSLNQPIWIIGALQEAIEKTGDIQKSVFDKIKDRYRARLELSTRHIRELIDRRLVIKTPAARTTLKKAHAILKTSFNNIRITEDLFCQIYPVHPECLELLDLSTHLFSQRRGVVDFIHYQLTGDPARHITGLLESDYLELLTPDRIFDHFYVQIKENPGSNKLYTIYQDHFEKRIPELFDNPTDAQYALKAIKILILLKILPVKTERNVQELANMLLYRSSEFSLGDINYEYFEETILKRLQHDLDYLIVTKKTDKFHDIYEIDVAAMSRDVIEEHIKSYLQSLKGQRTEVLTSVWENLESALFPWGQMHGVESHRKFIKWQCSLRDGHVILDDIRNYDLAAYTRILNLLGTDENDFFVMFGYPFETKKQQDQYQALIASQPQNRHRYGVICVLPSELSSEVWEKLETFSSILLVLEDFKADNSEKGLEIKARLKKKLTGLGDNLRPTLESAYADGFLYTADGRIEQSLREPTDSDFDAILARIIRYPLEQLYPLFNSIAPLEVVSSYTLIKELFRQFILPGVIEDLNHPQYRTLLPAIHNIAVPLGIADSKGRRSVLQGDLNRSAGLRALYDAVDAEKAISIQELGSQLRNSELGMNTYLFDLLLTVLLRKGHLVAQQNHNAVSVYQLQFPLHKCIDTITRGQLIPIAAREKLQALAKNLLKEDLDDFDIQKQELIWTKLREFQERVNNFLELTKLKFNVLQSKYHFTDAEIPNTRTALQNLKLISSQINRTLGSKPGLEKLLANLQQPEQLRFSTDQMRNLNRFFEMGLLQFEFIYNYIHDPHLFIPPEPTYQEFRTFWEKIKSRLVINDNLLLEEGIKYLQGLFADFLDLYKSRYVQEHEASNRALDLEHLNQLQILPEYKLLEQFSKISLISVQDDFVKINKTIENYKKRFCHLPVAETLDRIPCCSCGFQLGQPLDTPSIPALQAAIHRGIEQYVQALQDGLHQRQIQEYLANMVKLNRPVPQQPLEQILTANPAQVKDAQLPQLAVNVTPEVIQHINQAMAGDVKIVIRNIDELIENLIDRRYPKAKIAEIVEKWLNGSEKINDQVYVEVVSREGKF